MKLITRDTDYAIRAVILMARQKDRRIPVSRFTRELNIPRAFLRKILQSLNRQGVLSSYKGKGGGFSLSRDPAGILLADLIGIFQGRTTLNECMLRKKTCPQIKSCVLRKKIKAIERHVISRLRSISIGSLIKEGRR